MKVLPLCMLLVLTLACSDGNDPLPGNRASQSAGSTAKVTQLILGSSFGECGGYCRSTMTLSADGIILVKQSWEHEELPDIEVEASFREGEWEALMDLVGQTDFLTLKDEYGCPDCWDQGAEWLDLRHPDWSKSLRFDYGMNVEGLSDILTALRQIRSRIDE